jgi:hypothetical protein
MTPEPKFTKGPLHVEQQPSWPYRIDIVTTDGEIVESHDRVASSTRQKSLADCMAGVGFRGDERDEVVARMQRQMADAYLRCAAPELFNAVLNLLGLFDNPVYRRRLSGDPLYDAAITHARLTVVSALGETPANANRYTVEQQADGTYAVFNRGGFVKGGWPAYDRDAALIYARTLADADEEAGVPVHRTEA